VRIRASYVLPAIGLTLFGTVTCNSFAVNRAVHRHPNKYFYWTALRLDTDPLNKHPELERPCEEGDEPGNCTGWDLLEMHSYPSGSQRTLELSGLPAIVLSIAISTGLGRLGLSQLVSFMATMPPLLFAWYYFVGWLVDRAIGGRFPKRTSPT
jgi:hypothetical protein